LSEIITTLFVDENPPQRDRVSKGRQVEKELIIVGQYSIVDKLDDLSGGATTP
jgi:hypothetical protein